MKMSSNLLEINDLYVNAGEKEILKGMNLIIKKGEIHVIMGPNGSGKTTTANAIFNNPEYKKINGTIKFENADITDSRTDEIARKGVFMSFQLPEEIPGVSVSNFLKYAYDYSKTDEYDLLFWNHGGAIDGSEYDELSNNDNLNLKEMNEALFNSPFKNKKLEIVIFRTCLNGTVEVNSVFSKYAKYLVASEEITLGAK